MFAHCCSVVPVKLHEKWMNDPNWMLKNRIGVVWTIKIVQRAEIIRSHKIIQYTITRAKNANVSAHWNQNAAWRMSYQNASWNCTIPAGYIINAKITIGKFIWLLAQAYVAVNISKNGHKVRWTVLPSNQNISATSIKLTVINFIWHELIRS